MKLSEIRNAIRAYTYCQNGYHGPHDPYNYTTWDDWEHSDRLMKELVGWQRDDSGPLFSRSDFDERPYTERGKVIARIVRIADDLMNWQAGYYNWLVDSSETRRDDSE